MLKTPATRKMQVRGPLACTQARKDPVPESFVLVTSITTPPRPPTEAAPPPAAPGKAGHGAPLQDADWEADATGAATVTLATAVLVESALLIAVTVSLPACADAV
jgi:hypothetical protein